MQPRRWFHRWYLTWLLLAGLAAGCRAPVDESIGAAGHPVKILFVPSMETSLIQRRAEGLVSALRQATGYTFTVVVPAAYADTLTALCASPTDTLAFVPSEEYVLARQQCGVEAAYKAVRFGYDVEWAEILVARAGPLKTLADLDGQRWAYPDPAALASYRYPLAWFQAEGVTPGAAVAAGSQAAAVRAVYAGEADFATVFFSPPRKPDNQPAWRTGDAPDIPDELLRTCAPAAENENLWCGDWRVLDARALVRQAVPDVVQALRILAITPPLPNATVAFSAQFPAEMRRQIGEALRRFARSDGWATSLGSQDFYGWSGLNPATDAEYDPIRQAVEAARLSLENLGE